MNRELLSADISKADIELFTESIVSKVFDGDLDPLSVHIRSKAVIKALEAIVSKTEELARDNAQKYGDRTARRLRHARLFPR
jgi:hypothetical protein